MYIYVLLASPAVQISFTVIDDVSATMHGTSIATTAAVTTTTTTTTTTEPSITAERSTGNESGDEAVCCMLRY